MRLTTNIFDIIHEEFHVMGATLAGDQARVVSQSYTQVSRLSLLFLLSGYWGELLLYFGVAIAAARIRGWLASIPAGIYFAVLLAAVPSDDFQRVARWTDSQVYMLCWIFFGVAGAIFICTRISKRWRKANDVSRKGQTAPTRAE